MRHPEVQERGGGEEDESQALQKSASKARGRVGR